MTEAQRRRLPLRGIVLFGTAIVATVAFVALAQRVVAGHADALDHEWAVELYRSTDSALADAVMITFTWIGSGPCLWGSILLVGFLASRRGHWQYGVILIGSGLAALVVNTTLKLVFARARPELWDVIARPQTYSFPSGHAMSAMSVFGALATVLIALFPRRRTLLVACAAIIILGVGLSRVYLGVHWPTDVLAGYAAAIPFVVISVHLVHRTDRVLGT